MPENKRVGKTTAPQELRTKERLLHIERVGALSAEESRRLLAELAVYQAELEAQNEELRLAELRIELERRRYIDLFQSAPIGYLTLDKSYKVSDINQAAMEILNKPRRLLVDQPLANFVGAADLARLRDCLTQASETATSQTCDVQIRRGEGQLLPVQLLASAIVDGGLESKAVLRVSIVDNAERKAAEKHQKDLSLHFNRLSAELMTTSAEMETIAHSVAHELRRPIQALTKTLRDLKHHSTQQNEADGDQVREAESALAAIEQLASQLQNLTSLGTASLIMTDVDLTRMAHAIVTDLHKAEPERRVSIAIANDLHARGDSRLLALALTNLFSNAWKFTRETPDARIAFDVLAGTAGRQVYFIRDNGIGFDPQHADKIFLPFQRAHEGHEHQGVAMGLPIVSRVIRRHGGTIWAESEPGKGAAFYFTLGN